MDLCGVSEVGYLLLKPSPEAVRQSFSHLIACREGYQYTTLWAAKWTRDTPQYPPNWNYLDASSPTAFNVRSTLLACFFSDVFYGLSRAYLSK